MHGENLSPPTVDVVLKTCWAVTQLLKADTESRDNAADGHVCQSLCTLFVAVGHSRKELEGPHNAHIHLFLLLFHAHIHTVQNLIVEALTLLPTDILLSVLNRLKGDIKLHFVVRLEQRECPATLKAHG